MKNIINAIKNCNYNYIGVRSCTPDETYSVGDTCRNSYDWDYESDISTYDTDDPIELNGACAVDTHIDPTWDDDDEITEKLEKALKIAKGYSGKKVILGSDNTEYGMDGEEIIMEDAKVIAVFNKN